MLSALFVAFSREPEALEVAQARIIPFSKTPYAAPGEFAEDEKHDGESLTQEASPNQEHVPYAHREGPPEWLGIFFDLAWTTTFSNLTSNTEITTTSTVFSYCVFFILAWWLWAAQVTYDTKFYSNDWFHRILLIIQLTVFGALAGFTKDFDPFSKFVNPNLDTADWFSIDEYSRKAMLGVSLIFAISRIFLAISYARVVYYIPKVAAPGALTPEEIMRNAAEARARQNERRHLIFQAVTFLVSAVVFFISYLIVLTDLKANSVVGKIFMWLFAITLEVGVYCFSNFPDTERLFNEDTMGERLGTLTTIILGEALTDMGGSLISAISTLGFGMTAVTQTASAAVVTAFIFFMYFLGYKKEMPKSMKRGKFRVLLHLPLHLIMILLLEGVKNMTLYAYLVESLNAFKIQANPPNADLSQLNAAREQAYRNLGIDYMAQFQLLSNQTDSLNEIENRLGAQAILALFNNYHLADDRTQDKMRDYIDGVNASASRFDDWSLPNSTFMHIANKVLIGDVDAVVWIPSVSGLLLVLLAVLVLVNSKPPRHRFIAGSVLSRTAFGLALALSSLLILDTNGWTGFVDGFLLLPTIAATFVVVYIIDELLSYSVAKRAKLFRERERVLKTA